MITSRELLVSTENYSLATANVFCAAKVLETINKCFDHITVTPQGLTPKPISNTIRVFKKNHDHQWGIANWDKKLQLSHGERVLRC